LSYKVFIESSAQKDLSKIPQQYQNRIIKAIRALSQNPHPAGSKKLSGRDAWRIRVGNYRIIYEIHDDRLIILIVVIGHRKDIYRS
jgi:mRNA interferase RelE/StbE